MIIQLRNFFSREEYTISDVVYFIDLLSLFVTSRIIDDRWRHLRELLTPENRTKTRSTDIGFFIELRTEIRTLGIITMDYSSI